MTITPNQHSKIRDILHAEFRRLLDKDIERRLGRQTATVYADYWEPGDDISAKDADLGFIWERICSDQYDVDAGRSPGRAEAAQCLAASAGLPVECAPALEVGLAEASLKAWKVIERRTLGLESLVFPSKTPASPDEVELSKESVSLAERTAPLEAVPEALDEVLPQRLSALVEPYFVRRQTHDKATLQVIGQERGTVRRFIEACGDRAPSDYSRSDVLGFLDQLRRLPATYGRSPRDKDISLKDLIARADAEHASRLKEKTIKRHHSALSQLFMYAVNQGYLSLAHKRELFSEVRFALADKAREQRDMWLPEELTALFKSPIWTGSQEGVRSKPGPYIIRDAKFWLPLLGIFHGGRLEEFADLRGRDVAEIDGVQALVFQEAEDRRLKNDNAVRTIPLHPEMVRLGFLEYVRETVRHPDDPLFPELEPQGADRKRGPRFTRFFVHYRRQIGIYRKGVGMHAFRHTANTRLRDVISGFQQERHVAYLFGHGQAGGEGRERYDKGPALRAAAETLAMLKYPELDLSHLYVSGKKQAVTDTSAKA